MKELNASWTKKFETMEELKETERKVKEFVYPGSDILVFPFESSKELLVTVWITSNVEYWDKKLTEILGEKDSD